MYLLGSFVAQQFAKGAEQDDLDFFTFPEIDSTIGTDAIEAPIDGYMMSKRPKNEDGAKKLLGYVGSADAQNIAVKADPSVIATNDKADQAAYTLAAEEVGGVRQVGQVDRPVPRPRHPARLRVHGDDPGDPDLHQDTRRHRRAGATNIQKQKLSIFAS